MAPHCSLPPALTVALPPLPPGLQTAGDAAGSLMPFGLDLGSLQQWTLIYLGLSSMAFVIVWVVGFLRR